MGWEDDPVVEDFGANDPIVDEPSAKAPKERGFFDQHPNLQTAMRYGLPLGAAVATMPFTGGMSLPAMLATEGVASLGAESLNQALGVNEHSAQDLGLALAAPGAGRLVGSAVAQIPRLVPGFGEALRGALTPELKGFAEKLLPGSSKEFYDQLAKSKGGSTLISSFPALGSAVKELETNVDNVPWQALQQKLKMTGQENLFDQISTTLRGSPATTQMVSPTIKGKTPSIPTGLPKMPVTVPGRAPGLTFDEAKAGVEGFGKVIRTTTDDAERGVYKKLYSSMLSDLENAPMPAKGDLRLWQQARQMYKIEKARFALNEATERAIKTKDGVDVIDPNKIVDWLRKSDEVKSRLSPTEYRRVLNEYRNMASLAGHNMGKVSAMLLGAFAGGGAGGALAGYGASELLSKAMMTEPGRQAVRKFVGDPSRSTLRRMFMATGTEIGAALHEGEGE